MTDTCYVKIYDEAGEDVARRRDAGPPRRPQLSHLPGRVRAELPRARVLRADRARPRGGRGDARADAGQPARLPIFPLEVRTDAADDALPLLQLRPATDRRSPSRACPGTRLLAATCATVDRLLGEFGARVHWGKLHFLTREQLLGATRSGRLHRDPPRARPGGRLPQRPPAAAVRMSRSLIL